MLRDRIRGSLIGGAAGDALGYAIECLGAKEIVNAEETEMEIATDETISFCMECGKNMRFSDHYCGYCGARSSWWKEK